MPKSEKSGKTKEKHWIEKNNKGRLDSKMIPVNHTYELLQLNIFAFLYRTELICFHIVD